MSSKRQATSDLNHDNWDRDEEPEERGTFKTASEDELKNRVIKKARRKVADSADGGSATKSASVFSGFSGFGKPATATTAASPFSFLSKIPASTTTAFGTSTSSATDTPKATFSFGTAGSTSSTAPNTATSTSTFSFGSTSSGATTKETKGETETTSSDAKSSEYYAKLKGLNQAVSEWIKTHVDKNPLCILTPIFKDYEKYLTELEEEKTKPKSTTSTTADNKSSATTTTAGIGSFKFSETTATTAQPSTSSTTAPTFSFSSSSGTTAPVTESAPKTNGFSFGLKKPEVSKEDSKPASTGFSFGLKSSTAPSTTSTAPSSAATTSATPSFSFGKPASTSDEGSAPKPFSFTPGGTPFSFGNIKPPEAAPASTENDDEDEEPPKNEFKQVVEKDAVYSKKCKVFVKKEGNFVDKGVGTLYLKPVESSGKTQLLVRADTNLGNILVNLILSSAIPSQRMGKNNVMMVCVPSPDVEKPTPMLLRVKTGEEADELLENIEKYKK